MERLSMTDMTQPLPLTVPATDSFAKRIPTQRVIDAVEKAEGVRFSETIQHQPLRVVAFRALLRDYPDRDVTSLWLHSYDVEVEIIESNPTNGTSPTLAPPSADSGTSTRTP
jgi:hypothetical protein